MSTTDNQALDLGIEISSKMDALDKSLATLLELQTTLDRAGFSMASIHLNDTIETLRCDKVRLQERFKV